MKRNHFPNAAAVVLAYTSDQVAHALSMSPESVEKWIRLKKIATVRFGRSQRIPKEELDRVLRDGITFDED